MFIMDGCVFYYGWLYMYFTVDGCVSFWMVVYHFEWLYFKGAFELYGADFMLAEDMSPWLIEINSSPSMARNTRATCKLVDGVLEDTLKGKCY